ncbi:MAG: hypothetical protein DWQ19_10670 [Crenarchaeota archaeon]|nr:MAG: hypothetical protein DWQ19_10670 [Thermoproteota archaeon]
MLERDLELISGNFFELELPKSKRYLLKYFKTDIQRQFIRYYLIFGTAKYFVQHTGCYCQIRWRQLMLVKYKTLEKALKQARKNMNFNLITLIESGKFKLAKYNRGEYNDQKDIDI